MVFPQWVTLERSGDTGRREIDDVLGSVEVCPREHCIGGHGLREEEALQLIASKL